MNESLTKAATKLHNKIQWLLDNGKISEKQISDYNEILDLLQKTDNETENYIKTLQNDIMAHSLSLFHLKENILRLEAICLIHGILNINHYLNKAGLIKQATEAVNNKEFTMPYVFLQKENLLPVNDIINFHYSKL